MSDQVDDALFWRLELCDAGFEPEEPRKLRVWDASRDGVSAYVAVIGDPASLYVCSDAALSDRDGFEPRLWAQRARNAVVTGSTAPRIAVHPTTAVLARDALRYSMGAIGPVDRLGEAERAAWNERYQARELLRSCAR